MNSPMTAHELGDTAYHRAEPRKKDKLLAVVRFLIFALVVGAVLIAIDALIGKAPVAGALLKSANAGVLDPRLLWIVDSVSFSATLLVCAVVARLERCSISAYGLSFRGEWLKSLVQGMLFGLTLAFADIGLTWLLGGYSFGQFALSGWHALGYGLAWGVGFLLAGLFEEYLYRGYALFTLSRAAGFWPAAVLLAAIFAALHLLNHGESIYGVLDVAIYALFASLTLRRKGSLWFAIGLHASWDFSLTFLYSVSGSGMNAQNVLLHSHLLGRTWLTGGSAGPEGSAVGMGVLLAAFAACARWMPRAATPQESFVVGRTGLVP